MIKFLRTLLSCPIAMFCGIAGVSFFALFAALYSEVVLDLQPCPLCIYQRIPFLIGGVLGIIGLFLRQRPKIVDSIIGLAGLGFLVNSGIAFYHSGVERKWWESAVEGCNVNLDALLAPETEVSTQSILQDIMSAPTANCAEIPWEDPLLGLSMANYNVLLCFGIFVACVLSLLIRKTYGSGCVIEGATCD
ncbi:MAG: disulfide bond formation protein B [Bdellovibrionales bacterium]